MGRGPHFRDSYHRDRNLVHGGYFRLRQSHGAAFGNSIIMTWKYLIAAIAVAILALWTADLLGVLAPRVHLPEGAH